MKKLLVVASFFAVTAYPVAACDWTRAASTDGPVVVAASADAPVVTSTVPQAAAPALPETKSMAVDESAGKSSGEQAAIVLITDRH